MFSGYHHHPILAIYYYPDPDKWDHAQISRDLAEIAGAQIQSIWLFFDSFYDKNALSRLRDLLDEAQRLGLTVTPVLGQFLQLDEYPEVKIVNADGTTSDNPRYWNMGCFRHPTVFERATAHAVGFLRDFGGHSALYRLDGKVVMSFVHEAYYRNSVPEYGGPAMQPSCYCEHCQMAFRDYLIGHNLNPDTEPPRDASDPDLWQHWQNCHAEAIPAFLARLIRTANNVMPVYATHELNDFYPASWQSVYTGNDWWRMGAVLDIGHEDMYPLEFDHRYQCYVYDYAKDVMRSAVGFNKLITGNGQAFDSWQGYKLPTNSMSEQIYSCLAHGALGLVWWGQWPSSDTRYALTRQTQRYNAEYAALVAQLEGWQLAQAEVALLYSWTSMSQALNDEHTYDTLLAYMLLVQCGYPVDLVSEEQVAGGILAARGYKALLAMGCSALPTSVHQAIEHFVEQGGLLVTDHAPKLNDAFQPLYSAWRGIATEGLRLYTLPDRVPVPVQISAGPLHPPREAQIIARFEDDSPAICRIPRGQGAVILAGSYLGWDYSNYPGYYDLAAMFPFHTRRDAALRRWLADTLENAGA
ncbi:MAG: hypothetical protein HY866_13395, partial [Chloroflexi bacterium]|nr:hypothetical protein [Chloroflexota bacterium]